MLLRIREGGKVAWEGSTHTKPIPGLDIFPKPVQDPLPIWIAVGGTPNSVARAAYYGLPLMIAIIGGQPKQFAPLVKFYRETAEKVGRDPRPCRWASAHTASLPPTARTRATSPFLPIATR